MKAEIAKEILNDTIREIDRCKWLYCANPDKDFTRVRKLSFSETISAILSFRGGTLNHDLRDYFRFNPALPTSSAFYIRGRFCHHFVLRGKCQAESDERTSMPERHTDMHENAIVLVRRKVEGRFATIMKCVCRTWPYCL